MGCLRCRSRAIREGGSYLCTFFEVPYLFVIMSSEFLAELNWEEGFAIPVANEENKILEDLVRIR